MHRTKPASTGLTAYARIAPAMVMVLAAVVMGGWVVGSPSLRTLFAGDVTIKPNAALSMILAAGAVLAVRIPTPWARRFALAAMGIVAAVAGLTLLQYATGINL